MATRAHQHLCKVGGMFKLSASKPEIYLPGVKFRRAQVGVVAVPFQPGGDKCKYGNIGYGIPLNLLAEVPALYQCDQANQEEANVRGASWWPCVTVQLPSDEEGCGLINQAADWCNADSAVGHAKVLTRWAFCIYQLADESCPHAWLLPVGNRCTGSASWLELDAEMAPKGVWTSSSSPSMVQKGVWAAPSEA